MTAVVNIHVDKVDDVVAVPVHSVVQVDSQTWCYVEGPNGVERRDVEIGRSNEKFVHIREGLTAGDRVVMNPMDIFDEQQQQATRKISPQSGEPEMPADLAEAAKQDAASRTATGNGGPRGPGGMQRGQGPGSPGAGLSREGGRRGSASGGRNSMPSPDARTGSPRTGAPNQPDSGEPGGGRGSLGRDQNPGAPAIPRTRSPDKRSPDKRSPNGGSRSNDRARPTSPPSG